ncbi:MAG TPA: hypothetical protein VFA09_16080 [Ktedonobacteraceae bacterium]|nr:hypothetical protein [Ktedonobacteraceae bacterium]
MVESYPHYCPYEVLLARLAGGSSSDEQAVARARQQLYEAYDEGRGEVLLRPLRNVLSRVRLKLHVLGLDVVAMVETGYLLRAVKARTGSSSGAGCRK